MTFPQQSPTETSFPETEPQPYRSRFFIPSKDGMHRLEARDNPQLDAPLALAVVRKPASSAYTGGVYGVRLDINREHEDFPAGLRAADEPFLAGGIEAAIAAGVPFEYLCLLTAYDASIANESAAFLDHFRSAVEALAQPDPTAVDSPAASL